MNKVKISDLFEQEDVFKGIRKSAIDTIETLQQVQTELKESAKVIQNDIKNSSTSSAKGLKEFSSAAKAASQVMKDSAAIAKQQAQAEQQKIKVDQELVKLEKLKAQEIARANKEAEKAAAVAAKVAKETANQNSAYKQLEKSTRDLKNQSKELGAQLLAMEKAGNQGTAAYAKLEKQFVEVTNEARKLDTELKDVDKSVGDNFRNVGNYEGATKNLKTELRALTRELMNMSESDPKFQQMAQRAGELKDQIQDTQAVVKATAGSAMENFAGSVAKVGQIGVAAFQGMESSMVLLGVENEAVLQSMQKLQALAGLGDALKTLGGLGDMLTEIKAGFVAAAVKMGIFTTAKQADTAATVVNTTATEAQAVATVAASTATTAATGAMKLMRIALISLGIGAIMIAVGLLVENFDKLVAVGKAFTDFLGISDFKSEDIAKNEAARVDRRLKDQERLAKQRENNFKNEISSYDRKIKLAEAEGKSTYELEKAKITASINYQETKKKELEQELVGLKILAEQASFIDEMTGGALTERIKGLEQLVKEAEGSIEDQKIELKILDIERKKSGNNTVNDAKENADEINKIREEAAKKEQERILNLDKERRESLDAIQQAESEYQDTLLSDQIQEENAVREKYFILIEQAKKYGQDITVLTEAQQTALTAIDKKYSNQRIAIEKARRENILNQEEEFLNQYQTEINSDKQNEINSVREKYFTLIETAKQYGYDTKVLEEKQRKALADIDTKYSQDEVDKTKENEEKRKETIEAFANKTAEYFKKKSDEKIKAIDAEISAAEKQSETLKNLAAEGNINAQQSLAENQRIIDQANLRKEKQLKKQQRIEAGLAIFKLFSANADKKNPLAATIKDTTGLLAFISSLPMFYDGTEDTGSNGQGVDGKGGFHAILHPNERVLPKSLNEQIGSMSNEQLTKIAQEYQNGRLVSKSNANSSLELAVLASKLDTLTDVIKNKPETNIALGEITQSAMNIVESKRTGNTTVYNRFRISK